MDAIALATVAGFALGAGLSLFSQAAAYRNGVTDGYGYAREPSCPGYQRAGRHLHKYMAHRWHELRG